jgi:hypothetical protein
LTRLMIRQSNLQCSINGVINGVALNRLWRKRSGSKQASYAASEIDRCTDPTPGIPVHMHLRSSRLASPARHFGVRPGSPGDAGMGRKSRIRFRLQTPSSPILGWKSPKVSGHVRGYSRFAETIGGDWFDPDGGSRSRAQSSTELLMTARQRTAGSGERKGARRTRSATPGSLYSQANSSSTGSSLWPNQSSSGSLHGKRRAFGQPASPCERFTAALASRTSCITRGRGGWLNLPHGGLPPPILCQLPGAPLRVNRYRNRLSAPCPAPR